jgi:phosphoenolpyruvate carboxykinase (GTP)
MAMLPFCGYNMGDYFGHWLRMGPKLQNPPRIFHVNWFRQDANGNFLWPGFGDNMRVLRWIIEECEGRGQSVETPIGLLPARGALDTAGLKVDGDTMDRLLSVSKEDWRKEVAGMSEFFEKFGDRLPKEIDRQRSELAKRLG